MTIDLPLKRGLTNTGRKPSVQPPAVHALKGATTPPVSGVQVFEVDVFDAGVFE